MLVKAIGIFVHGFSEQIKNLQAVAQHRAQASQAKKGTRKFVDSEGEYVVVFVS